MMSSTAWRRLGIDPTADIRTIKQAYYACLKQIRPDEDIAGFQELREAYEVALDTAPHVSEREDDSDDLPSWLADLAPVRPSNRQSAPWVAESSEPLASPVQEETAGHKSDPVQDGDIVHQPASPENDTQPAALTARVAHAIDQLIAIDSVEPACDYLHALWAERDWQSPDADQVLEAGLLRCLAHSYYPEEWSSGSRSVAEYKVAMLLISHYQWLARRETLEGNQQFLLGQIVDRFLPACVERVWRLADQGDLIGAQGEFQSQIDNDLFLHVDVRLILERAWANALCDAANWPDGLGSLVFEVFEWEKSSGKPDWFDRCSILLERRKTETDISLLADIASGKREVDEVTRKVAQALLADRIRFKIWREAVQPAWHAQMNRALAWLRCEAPSALKAVKPNVLGWWLEPRPVESDVWNFLPLIGWVSASLFTVHTLKKFNVDGWWLVVPVLMAMFCGIAGGYGLSRLMAWLRVQWALKVYIPWARFDLALAPRIPVIGNWLMSRPRIGPTRDIVPVLGFIFAVWPKHLANGLDAVVGFSLFMATFFAGVMWCSSLRAFSNAPGAQHWLALHEGYGD